MCPRNFQSTFSLHSIEFDFLSFSFRFCLAVVWLWLSLHRRSIDSCQKEVLKIVLFSVKHLSLSTSIEQSNLKLICSTCDLLSSCVRQSLSCPHRLCRSSRFSGSSEFELFQCRLLPLEINPSSN